MEKIQTRSSVACIHEGKEHFTIGYSSIIKNSHCCRKLDSSRYTKKLCKLVNNFTKSKSSNPMPKGQTDDKLAEEFATFFLEKIQNICNNFTGIEKFKPSTSEQVPLLWWHFCHSPAIKHTKEILTMNNKSCKLTIFPLKYSREYYLQY